MVQDTTPTSRGPVDIDPQDVMDLVEDVALEADVSRPVALRVIMALVRTGHLSPDAIRDTE